MNGSRENSVGVVVMLVLSICSVLFFTDNKNILDGVDTSDIEKSLMAIEYKSEKVEPQNELFQGQISKIVIHHTATPPNQNTSKLFDVIQKNHSARWVRGGVVKTGQQMMYHRLIGTSGTLYGTKDFSEIGRGTRENNIGVIHIALQGNFNEVAPTEAQYETLVQVINNLRQRYGSGLEIIGHGQLEHEATACPGKLFDWERLKKMVEPVVEVETPIEYLVNTAKKLRGKVEIPTDKSYNILFDLSRYYSPVPGQTHYFQGKTYEQDKKDQFGNDPDITTSATGKKYTMADKNRSVACPPSIPKGSKISLWIRGEGHTVTCEDRGKAIVKNRLDMYCGIGQYAIDNFDTCITGLIYGKILK